jgi:hypothetical protein
MTEEQQKGDSSTDAAANRQEDDLVDSVVLRRRPMWPFAVGFFAIVATIAGFMYWKSTRPEPLRVLVAIDLEGTWWDGSKPAAELADELAELLKKVGFEPVKGGDPEVDKILSNAKSPEEAARKLKAAFVITATFKPDYIEHPIAGGYTEVRIEAPLTVRHILDAEGKAVEARVSTWSGARTKERALSLMSSELASNVFAEASTAMMEHPTIATMIASDDIKAISQLQDAKAYVTRKAEKLDRARRAYEFVEKEHSEAKQLKPITYHSPWSADDAVGGTGPEGVLVRTRGVRPFVSPRSPDLKYTIELETLAWRSPDGKDKPVWKGYHLFSYPSASSAGAPIVFVEDIFGWAKTLTVVDAAGAAKRVRLEPEIRFIDPKIGKSGQYIATYERSCQRCDTVFAVLSAADGKTLYIRGAATTSTNVDGVPHELSEVDESFGGFAWLDESRAILTARRSEPLDDALAADDEQGKPAGKKKESDKDKETLARVLVLDASKSNAKMETLVPLDDTSRWGAPAVSRDAKLLAICVTSDTGSDLAIVDIAAKSVKKTSAAVGCADPTFSPDGSMVTFSEGSDIYVYRLTDGRADALTKNEDRERYPVFSSDGKRVYFETLRDDPNFGSRGLSVVSSVEVSK